MATVQTPANYPYGLYDENGDVHYAGNAKELHKMTREQGMTDKYTYQPFPKAMHGLDDNGNPVSISIPKGPDAEAQVQIALENGWSLQPVSDPVVIEESRKPSFDAPPARRKKALSKPAKPQTAA